ncbi:MAG: hypothetical protein KBS74_04605 [Clostridiales bacterium]|nr:hypothetical protein [Candidatus Cacconaster stercorequi]
MMKKPTRLATVLLALIIVFALLPASAFASYSGDAVFDVDTVGEQEATLPMTMVKSIAPTANAPAGDINGDGEVNNKDLTRLFQHLSDWDVEVVEANLDVNGDGESNNKDLTRLFQYLSDWDVEIFGGAGKDEITTESFVYGQSVRGRDLVCYAIAPESFDKTILLEFEIHGFEDSYAHDGQVLVDTAKALVEHYSAADDLNRTRLLIVPSSNPDGLLDGTTNNGFGRCNADGIDLNRDFDANYVASTTPGRNYTPRAFSGVESRALRDLCLEYKPDIVIDFHGWESSLIGDVELCDVFHEELGLNQTHSFTATNCKGYFCNWAHQQGALAMLVEFTSPTSINITRLENAVDRLIRNEYDTGVVTGDYSILEGKKTVFMNPSHVDVSTASETHYIEAQDICYISGVDVESGKCTVVYPANGTDVFAAGQATRTAQVSLAHILGSGSGYTMERKTAGSSNIKVYPTNELLSYSTNWYIDAGQSYYTIQATPNATAVLYYCSSGGHAGYWKIGWIAGA